MRRITLTLLFSFAGFVVRSQIVDVFTNFTTGTYHGIDTVSKGSLALPPSDTAIVSYEVTISLGGGYAYNKTITGRSLPAEAWMMLSNLSSGSKVLYDNIRKRMPNGGTIRLPFHLYVINYPDIFGDGQSTNAIAIVDTVAKGYYLPIDSNTVSMEVSIRTPDKIFSVHSSCGNQLPRYLQNQISVLPEGSMIFYSEIVLNIDGRIYKCPEKAYIIGLKNTSPKAIQP